MMQIIETTFTTELWSVYEERCDSMARTNKQTTVQMAFKGSAKLSYNYASQYLESNTPLNEGRNFGEKKSVTQMRRQNNKQKTKICYSEPKTLKTNAQVKSKK